MLTTLKEWLFAGRAMTEARRKASERLADELGVSADGVDSILADTMTRIWSIDDEADDLKEPGQILEDAARKLQQIGAWPNRAQENEIIQAYLAEMPRGNYDVLRHFKEGKSHAQIAEIMQTDVDTIRNCLVQTYADLRMSMVDAAINARASL